jgi:hypothetical protein
MPQLTWNNWNRSKGCRYWMDKKTYLGKTFSSIFWSAMRLLFLDENNKPGLLYQGKIYPPAKALIAANGRRYNFSEFDEIAMLKLGNFNYMGLPYTPFAKLLFEGPDQEDIGKLWGEGKYVATEIDIGFYDIVDTAVKGTGLGGSFPKENGLEMITYFTGAIVLHEIMHNHGFHHPDKVNWDKGSDYASSLPHVAAVAVLKASPYWDFFQPLIGSGYPTDAYKCCGSGTPAPLPITRQSGWRWCKKCECMFFAEISAGKCPGGGAHDKTASGKYEITINALGDSGQHFWRWCKKCQGLFYAGHGAGKCAAGAGHDSIGSGDYSLVQNVAQPGTQNNWRWCNKCQCLFFAGHGAGKCPAGTGHNNTGSGDYNVPLVG